MAYNPNLHHRRSIRLKGYDYSKAGLYFITICVEDRLCLFGEITLKTSVGACLVDALNVDDKNSQIMILNDPGKMIEKEWLALTNRFINIQLHEFIIMPNHFHGILEIVKNTDIHVRVPLVGTLDVDTSNDDNEPSNIHIPLVGTLDVDTQNTGDQNMYIYNDGIGQSPDKGQPIDIGQPQGIAPTQHKTVGDMMDAFKSITTVEYIRGVKKFGWQTFNGKLWQRNYYEHIIRNEESYDRISNYIINNPANWKNDKFNNG